MKKIFFNYRKKFEEGFFSSIRNYSNSFDSKLILILFIINFIISLIYLRQDIRGIGSVEDRTAYCILHILFTVFFIIMGVLLTFLNISVSLLSVGLKKKQKIWFVDHENVYEGFVNKLELGSTNIIIKYKNPEIEEYVEKSICISQFYLSKEDAINDVENAREYNDELLREIHSKWKSDKSFMEFYNNREELYIDDAERFFDFYITDKQFELDRKKYEKNKREALKKDIDKFASI